MKTYKQIHISQISEILMQAAMGVSAVCGYKFTIPDMVYSLHGLAKRMYSQQMNEPYYIAIREMGTESGSKAQCLESCKCLGYPLVIAKIEEDKVCDYNMTITFTHGWMDGFNSYMEQEFNSI